MFLFPKEFHFFAIPGIPPLRGSCSPHHLLLLLVGYGLYLDIKIRKRCKTIYCSHWNTSRLAIFRLKYISTDTPTTSLCCFLI